MLDSTMKIGDPAPSHGLRPGGHISFRRSGSVSDFLIFFGRDYFYTIDLPKGCCGARYRLHREILDVPSYQTKLLVECLSGKDVGLWFTCTPANFERRYKLAEDSAK